MLKARVLGRRIYGPSEFRPVKDLHVGHHFGLLRPVGYLAQSGANLTFGLLKAHVFYGLEIFTPVDDLLLLRAQIMFTPVKGPLWAQAYQKNMKSYADLGPDIFSGLHANFGP